MIGEDGWVHVEGEPTVDYDAVCQCGHPRLDHYLADACMECPCLAFVDAKPV